MAIIINDNYQLTAPKPFDARYMNISAPWSSVGAANAGILPAYRYIGLTVNINGTEYWYANGITDSDLVPKVNAGTLSGATNGLHLAAGGTQVALGGVLSGDTEFSGGILKYTTHPTFIDDTQIIDKKYADTVAVGVHPKLAAHLATTTNIDLTGGTFVSGSTIDSIIVKDGWRILVKDQANDKQNGVWIYSASTSGFTRSDDFDATPSGETRQGTLIPVITGATNVNTLWVLVEPEAYTGYTQSVVFTLFSSPTLTAGNGIIISGSTISVDGANLAGTYINWSGTQFIVDCASIISGLATQSAFNAYTGSTQPVIDAALTGATNGLSTSGRNVCLGGTLLSDVTINGQDLYELKINNVAGFQVSGGTTQLIVEPAGITLAYSGESVSFDSCGGLKYDGDYSANFTARSVPDVAFVTGLTTGSTVYAPPLAQYSTVCVGGVDVATDLYGMTSNQILEKILVKYLAPTFSTFTVSVPTTVEIGCSISGLKTFSWGFVNGSNVCPVSMCVSDVTAGNPICNNFPITCTPTGLTVATKCFNVTCPIQQWRGFAKNTCGATICSSVYTSTGIYPYYWGICTCPGGAGCNRPTATCAMVLGGTKVLAASSGSISITFNSTDNDYLWFAVPATVSKVCWCTPSAPTNNGAIGGGISPACNLFPAPDIVSVTSTCWSGVNYNVYISNAQTGVVIPMALT